MIKASEVLDFLIPQGGWIIVGDEYEKITWIDESVKISKETFENGFLQLETHLDQLKNNQAKAKAALLEKLGITEEEAKLLLG